MTRVLYAAKRAVIAIPTIVVLIVCIIFASIQLPVATAASGNAEASAIDNMVPAAEAVSEASSTWIVKWNAEPPEQFWAETERMDYYETMSVWLVQPKTHIDVDAWRAKWSAHTAIAYIQPNQKVQLLAAPDDTYYARQNYLTQIRAPEAWDVVRENTSIIIALIDTGVDLDHPDLKDSVIDGVNLITPGQLPEDDHGHGTNVAGVVAATGNNGTGITGLSWKSKIMPVKALEASGQGDEIKLGEGIRYAVDHDAKIIVLSVGLVRYSPFLQEVADYAEEKGVLLISASGNEGREVRYPAAFPTVLAVGGVDPRNNVMTESNYGPEIDLVAPWTVYTTAMDGQYQYNYGTSMAAPQVAGAAALILSKNPNMKPFEVRNLLQQTAEDIETHGWDEFSGYGLLRVDRAVTERYRNDMYEPNDSRLLAKRLPLDTMIYGELSSGSDKDWFFINPMYNGDVRLHLTNASGATGTNPKVKLTFYSGDSGVKQEFMDIMNNPPLLQVKSGRSYMVLEYESASTSTALRYKLKSEFQIYKDPFEDNDRQFKAYKIPINKQPVSLTGTFHQLNDQDWYYIQVENSGSLELSVTPDNGRMDVAVMIQKTGEKAYIMDQNEEGGSETISAYDLMPGRYYILVSNVINDDAYSVRGEYELRLRISPKLIDPNEPNDRAFQATEVVMNTEYMGLIHQATDSDWFTFNIAVESYVSIKVDDIPSDKLMLMTLYNENQTQLALNINSQSATSLVMNQVLKAGSYYVKLASNKAFLDKLYRFTVQADMLVSGFRDINGHWAQTTIANMSRSGMVSGYGDYTFRPDRDVTRAEAVAMLVKAFKFTNVGLSGRESFQDIPDGYWAAEAIQIAVSEGMISGYDDGTFRPNQPIRRSELAVMIARGMGLKPSLPSAAPFTDVDRGHWAAGWLDQLSKLRIVSGYSNGSYKPADPASRAEMTVLASKVVK